MNTRLKPKFRTTMDRMTINFRCLFLTCVVSLLVIAPAKSELNRGERSVAQPVVGKDDPCNEKRPECPKMPKNGSDAKSFMDGLAKASRHQGEVAMKTVGKCMHGVSMAVGKVCYGESKELAICGNASGSGKCLRAMGFVECEFNEKNRDQRQDDVQDPKHQIPGAIFVYSGGPEGNGHIEVYTGNLKWCSDHCSILPMQSTLRKPEAIYLPPGITPPADWKCVPPEAK